MVIHLDLISDSFLTSGSSGQYYIYKDTDCTNIYENTDRTYRIRVYARIRTCTYRWQTVYYKPIQTIVQNQFTLNNGRDRKGEEKREKS